MYQERIYRKEMTAKGLSYFSVVEDETDLYIAADRILKSSAQRAVHEIRSVIIDYGKKHPEFLNSLAPLEILKDDPPVIAEMKRAAALVNVGPMAAVAGAVSDYVGKVLKKDSKEIIVENGGDLYLDVQEERHIAIVTNSPAFEGLTLKIPGKQGSLGICTSSGTLGHSLSFGKADAATVLSHNAILADAAATALGNRVKKIEDIGAAMEWIQTIPEVTGALVIIKDKLGAWGEIQFG